MEQQESFSAAAMDQLSKEENTLLFSTLHLAIYLQVLLQSIYKKYHTSGIYSGDDGPVQYCWWSHCKIHKAP